MWGYDVIVNAGTPAWALAPFAGPMDLSTQAFIAVDGKDSLGVTPEEPEDPHEPEVPAPIDLAPIVGEMNETQRIQLQTIAAIVGLAESIDGMRQILENIRAHDLVIADEIRQLKAAATDGAEKVRAQIAGGVRVRL